jgi:predicted GNAT family acetyltransferase
MTDPTITVNDNPASHRYEIFVDGDLAGFSAYRDEPGRRVFTHTKIDPDYEGQGLGSKLARAALDDARRQQLHVLARCPFIAEYIERHPDYADLTNA